MVKLNNVAQRLPGGEGVAVLAGQIELAVRASGDIERSSLVGSAGRGQQEARAGQHQQRPPHQGPKIEG